MVFDFGSWATLTGNSTSSSPLIDPPENTILSAVAVAVQPAGAWAVTPVSGVAVGRSISILVVFALSSSLGTLKTNVAFVPPGLASLLCTVMCASAAAAPTITRTAAPAAQMAARPIERPAPRATADGLPQIGFAELIR